MRKVEGGEVTRTRFVLDVRHRELILKRISIDRTKIQRKLRTRYSRFGNMKSIKRGDIDAKPINNVFIMYAQVSHIRICFQGGSKRVTLILLVRREVEGVGVSLYDPQPGSTTPRG